MPAAGSTVALDPDHAAARFQRAMARKANKDLTGAETDLSELIERFPIDPGHCFHRGLLRAQSGRPREALADFNEAIRLEPQVPAFYFQRAYAAWQLGRTESDPVWRQAATRALASFS